MYVNMSVSTIHLIATGRLYPRYCKSEAEKYAVDRDSIGSERASKSLKWASKGWGRGLRGAWGGHLSERWMGGLIEAGCMDGNFPP